jgi:hypothetical protein
MMRKGFGWPRRLRHGAGREQSRGRATGRDRALVASAPRGDQRAGTPSGGGEGRPLRCQLLAPGRVARGQGQDLLDRGD